MLGPSCLSVPIKPQRLHQITPKRLNPTPLKHAQQLIFVFFGPFFDILLVARYILNQTSLASALKTRRSSFCGLGPLKHRTNLCVMALQRWSLQILTLRRGRARKRDIDSLTNQNPLLYVPFIKPYKAFRFL